MKLKTESIMKLIKTNGRAVLKMDRASGFNQLTITKVKGGYAVGEHPGGRIKRMTESDVYALIDDLAFLIEKWA